MHPALAGFFLDIIEAAIDHRIERIELALEFTRRSGPATVAAPIAAIAARPVIAAAGTLRSLTCGSAALA
jgi:hypothetical protein